MKSHWSICMEVLLTIVAMSMLFHSYPFRSSPKQHVLKTVAKASGDTLDEYLNTSDRAFKQILNCILERGTISNRSYSKRLALGIGE